MRPSAQLQFLSCSNVREFLQQDNARPQVARVCGDFLANNNIVLLDWPLYNPDLSTMEHLWDDLDKRVRKHQKSLAQLRNTMVDEWNYIPMRTVNTLVNSIQRRIRAAAAAMGVGGGTRDIDHYNLFSFPVMGVLPMHLNNLSC